MRVVRKTLQEDVKMNEEQVFLKIMHDLTEKGRHVSPRGQKVLEIENYSYTLPPYGRFMSFEARNLKLEYIKNEVLWYIAGNAKDTTILDKAKMWHNLVNDDGTINSNYGQYIFGEQNQFDNVVHTLVKDKDSRRAAIVILNHGHLTMETNDVPCTYSLNFRIRDDALNMSVHMRSQDGVFGMGNDAPAFSIVQEMLLHTLRAWYPELVMGEYHHIADSFHVYERHFGMIASIMADPQFTPIVCPKISGGDEVRFLRDVHLYKVDPREPHHTTIPDKYEFTRWLLNL